MSFLCPNKLLVDDDRGRKVVERTPCDLRFADAERKFYFETFGPCCVSEQSYWRRCRRHCAHAPPLHHPMQSSGWQMTLFKMKLKKKKRFQT